MRYLLSRAAHPILTQLAESKTLCAFDFDGTLAPIVDAPDQAGLSARTRQLLGRLATLYPCVILSGRARADLLPRLGAIPLSRVFGSHGAEGEERPRKRPTLQRWKAAIESDLGSVPGVWIEDKGLSLAVHYRQSPRRAEARQRILQATRDLEKARVFGGKMVVNVVVDGDPDKGTALAAERERLRCDTVLYVGDDQNDEDAFAINGEIVSVRIGRAARSQARYYLRNQAEIDTLLHCLASLREQKLGNPRRVGNSPQPVT